MDEATLHEKGLWRSPRLGIDAFLVRNVSRVRGGFGFEVALVKRGSEPCIGCWALPGGFVRWMEDPVDAVAREVLEETHLAVDRENAPAFVTFRGSPTRDPRAHSLSASYVAKVRESSLKDMQSGDDASGVQWVPIADLPALKFAFDHGDIARECAAWFKAHGKARGLYAQAGAAA